MSEPRKRGRPPGRSPGRQYDQVTVQLPGELTGALDRQAEVEGVSRSALIRAYCEEGLRRAGKRGRKGEG